MMLEHDEDIIRLRTVRALARKGKMIIGEEAFVKDPLGMMLLDALDVLENRTTNNDLAVLGLEKTYTSP